MIAVWSFYIFFTDAAGLLNINVFKVMILTAQNSHGLLYIGIKREKDFWRKSKKLENNRKRDAEKIKEI